MPEYYFRCDSCGHADSVIWPMSQSSELLECANCGTKMYRVYNFSIGGDEYSKPIVSDALAINPSQIPEHREHFPDVEVRPDGRPVFKNFRQHESYLEKTGFVKHDQKTRNKLGRTTIARMK